MCPSKRSRRKPVSAHHRYRAPELLERSTSEAHQPVSIVMSHSGHLLSAPAKRMLTPSTSSDEDGFLYLAYVCPFSAA